MQLWPQLHAAAVCVCPSYLGLNFSWVPLALGLLGWCCWIHGLEASCLCRVLVLLEGKEPTVHLGMHVCRLPTWVYCPDAERVEL